MASGHNSSVFTRSAWFYCEFDPLSKYGRMPRLFCREYYDIIPNQVLLCDENNNEIEVSVLKHLGRIYFIDGWRQIGNLYNVQEGAWLKLYYLSESEFMMSIQNRWMVEVDYPQPPRTVKLGVVSHTVIILDDEDDNPSGVCKSEQIDFSIDKMFTGPGKMANGEGSSHSRKHRWFYCEYDPLSKYGRMPRLFCRDFYDTIPSCILIRGVNGNEFEVSVVKKKGRIYLTGGWHQLGHLYNLPKGGWLKAYFLDDNEFIITVMNRELVEIEQQGEGQVRSSSLGLKDSHQQRPKLAPMASPTDDGGGNNKDSTNVCKDKHPTFSIEKRSTKRQLRSSGLGLKDSPLHVAKLAPIVSPTGQGFKNSHESNGWSINLSKVGASGKNALLIPARIVRNVIPMSQKVIYLLDGDQRHECKLLRRNRRRESECYIGRGWYRFCKEKRLRKGDCLKFYVNYDPHDIRWMTLCSQVLSTFITTARLFQFWYNQLTFLSMAPRITFLSDILPGKIDWKIRVRVIRLWKVPDFKNPLQLNSVEMILLDEQTAKIQASIKRSLLPRFEALVEEGSAYIIENLLVAQNDPKYKTTRHKYKLNFMGSTKCTKTDSEKIPPNYFEFVGFPQILGGTDNGFLIDVIGHVVVKEDIKETEKNGVKSRLIDITLEDLESNRIICTLWGDFADEMYQYLDKDDSSAPVVIILQLCKMKTFNGKMGISNAYNGTKLLINPNLTEVSEYKQKLENGNISITPVVSHMSEHTTISLGDDLLQTQRMTISDLIEASEKCFCTVLAEVIKVDDDKGWAYESCNKCLTKVTIVGTKYYCEKCEKMVVAVPRYKVQVQVMDKTGSTTFVLFDRILTQYLGKSAKELIELMDKGDVSANCPAEFDSLMDKPLLFKVENTKTNIELKWQSYIVKKMSNDKELIQQFKTLYSIQDDEDAEDTLNNVVSPQIDDNMKVVIEDDSERNVQMSQVEFNCNDGLIDDDEITPSSKGVGKRSADSVQKTLDFEDSGTQASGTKLAKIVAVKKEPID